MGNSILVENELYQTSYYTSHTIMYSVEVLKSGRSYSFLSRNSQKKNCHMFSIRKKQRNMLWVTLHMNYVSLFPYLRWSGGQQRSDPLSYFDIAYCFIPVVFSFCSSYFDRSRPFIFPVNHKVSFELQDLIPFSFLQLYSTAPFLQEVKKAPLYEHKRHLSL